MTAALETYARPTHATYGDEALAIIDAHRRTVDDHFSVETLDVEFPTLARQVGHAGLHLAHAEDNLAGAFKWRGAFVGAYRLAEKGAAEIVVPSAGNHARGAILAAKALNLGVHVVVPTTAPPAKKEQLASLWDSPKLAVHAVGKTFDDSLAWALERPEMGALLHPYDDPTVAAGQGTLVDDILQARGDTERLVVPVGGGGLLAGILGRLQELGRADVHVHAVEAPGSHSLSASLEVGAITAARQPNQRFGGSAVRFTGLHALALCGAYPNLHLQTVSEAEVDDVIDDYRQDRTELLRQAVPNLEPTSLVAVAGAAEVARANPNAVVTVVGTGQNDTLLPQKPARNYRALM